MTGAGLSVCRLSSTPGGTRLGPCIEFPDQAHFHPLRYLDGLAKAIERSGGRIHCGTHATSIDSAVLSPVAAVPGSTSLYSVRLKMT